MYSTEYHFELMMIRSVVDTKGTMHYITNHKNCN